MSASASASARRTPHVGDVIPMASYTMPAPTWTVKPQFAGWEIDHTRFEVKRLLGKGSYGSVAEAIDHLTGARVAIKKIPNIFEVRAAPWYEDVSSVRVDWAGVPSLSLPALCAVRAGL
ncbi:hypothetical protein EON67_01265 [archaeon]|nr:MAG: hypothetical protein EON67_01265 [archaeon]